MRRNICTTNYIARSNITERTRLFQVLVGNKCDMDESKRVVPYSKGQALADEFGIQFFETSAKSNLKVDEVQNLTAIQSNAAAAALSAVCASC